MPRRRFPVVKPDVEYDRACGIKYELYDVEPYQTCTCC